MLVGDRLNITIISNYTSTFFETTEGNYRGLVHVSLQTSVLRSVWNFDVSELDGPVFHHRGGQRDIRRINRESIQRTSRTHTYVICTDLLLFTPNSSELKSEKLSFIGSGPLPYSP